jgi:hypothetical protein
MAPCLDALGDDDVHARRRRSLGVQDRPDLVEDLDARGVSPLHIRRRIAPEEGEDGDVLLQIAQLGLTQDKLLRAGVETLAVVASDLERTRLYFRYQPTRVPLAVDPAVVTHRAFGVSKFPITPQLMEALQTTRTDVRGELPQPLPLLDAVKALDERDGFALTETDIREEQEHEFLDVGQFLIDRGGIVRWVNLESVREGLAGIGNFPSDEELLAVARTHGS